MLLYLYRKSTSASEPVLFCASIAVSAERYHPETVIPVPQYAPQSVHAKHPEYLLRKKIHAVSPKKNSPIRYQAKSILAVGGNFASTASGRLMSDKPTPKDFL
jgi:hypothetical protein